MVLFLSSALPSNATATWYGISEFLDSAQKWAWPEFSWGGEVERENWLGVGRPGSPQERSLPEPSPVGMQVGRAAGKLHSRNLGGSTKR